MKSICNYNSEFSVQQKDGHIYIYEWLGDSVIRDHVLTREEATSLVRNLLNALTVAKYGPSTPIIQDVNIHAESVEIEY